MTLVNSTVRKLGSSVPTGVVVYLSIKRINRGTGGVFKAVEYFRQAVEKDPNIGQAASA
jgi:hypothetical protein